MDMLAAPAPDPTLRKSVPWLFYGQTTSLCETCWELVPAKIIGEAGCATPSTAMDHIALVNDLTG